jgi:hypothetical protein
VRHLLTSVCALSLATADLSAQATGGEPPLPAYRHRLLGVFDSQSGAPLEGAEIMDLLSKTSALTTKTGTVSLVFLPEGGGLVRIRKVGYQPATLPVEISPDDTVPITVALAASVTALPAMITRDSAVHYMSPGLQAFEERRKMSDGHFLSEAELRKNDSRLMSNVIRAFPIGVVCPTSGLRRGECWAISHRQPSALAILGGGSCDVKVYINGALSTDNDLEKIKVNETAGVEFYAGATIPAQYNATGSSCGVLLFWTRER